MWALGAVQFARKHSIRGDRFLFAVGLLLTACFVGLRFEIGGDWHQYLELYELMYFQPLFDSLRVTDPGYAFFNWAGAQVDWGVWFPNLACALIFCAGLGRLARDQPNPWLAVLVAVPYLIIVVAMGYTRQAAAIGVLCYAVVGASERNILRLVVIAGIAGLFHKTAILMLLVLLAPVITRRFVIGTLGTLMFGFFFYFFLSSFQDRLVTNYVQASYDSQGAGIRVAMNVVAGGMMLVFRNRMGFDEYQKTFWTLNALLAVVSAVALAYLESSTGVDRIALFLIPLQIVTFSRLPYALSSTKDKALPSLLFGVMAYSFAVQYVWLNFADNAASWVPYKSFVWTPPAPKVS
jgi:hypothetical protein